MIRDYLPISISDMEQRGWTECDFVFVTGDAYVDHPSFGPAIISRVLESNGYKVGIIAQPDWKDSESIAILGQPRLGFLVSGGNMDSMVNHYSVAKKRRQTDAYSPGGEMGKRPDYATIVYCNLIRKKYKKAPIIIGGIEASLRRLAHYDYWSDKVKRSILLDSQADIISYGMGEHSIVEIADALNSGIEIKDVTFINGTVFKAKSLESVYDAVMLPSFTSILESKKEFARSFQIQYSNTDPYSGKRLVEPYKDNEYIVQNPPSRPLTQAEMDRVYALPYMRDYHPSYQEAGGIPAITEVKFSLVSNRGCFGGCNYCALTFHQGRILQTRSHESIVSEANQLVWDKDFKGYIHDVGGPTANFRQVACEKQNTKGACINKQCLFPTPCKSLKVDHSDYLNLLRKLRSLPNVKKVFIRSGIRFDYLVADKDDKFLEELCEHHVSGQLKVAPEHISDSVLSLMGKPENAVYEKFQDKYNKMNQKLGKNQFIVPYLISSHPGSTLKEAIELAEYLRDLGYMPEQVQDFYPTPSTISTCMYYTGLDPRTLQEVYVPKSPHEKAMQRALIQYRNPKNYDLVVEALKSADRMDLIGFDKKCLVRPRQFASEKAWVKKDNLAKGKGKSSDSKKQGTGKGKPSGAKKPERPDNFHKPKKTGEDATKKDQSYESRSGNYKPGQSAAGHGKPVSNKPGSFKPDSYKAGNSKSNSSRSSDSRPSDSRPSNSRPGNSKSEYNRSGSSRSGSAKTSIKKPISGKSGSRNSR
ncbi:MAG: Radical domain protein [Firmicutes bacterium]|nr:Radical domain protein [Bacillota bacterium]